MLIPGNSLITATPEEGRQLAMTISRLVIKTTQPDDAVRSRLRDVYANDATALLQVGQTVAIEYRHDRSRKQLLEKVARSRACSSRRSNPKCRLAV